MNLQTHHTQLVEELIKLLRKNQHNSAFIISFFNETTNGTGLICIPLHLIYTNHCMCLLYKRIKKKKPFIYKEVFTLLF